VDSSTILVVLVSLFLLLESANVLALYLAPESRRFNALGVFDAWAVSQRDPAVGPLVRYLAYWVAGTKVIFIALWLVILVVGEPDTQFWASVVMVPAIATFYWRMAPIARGLDRAGSVSPPGYSRVLGWMIAGFLAAFVVAIATARFAG
jgi:hypothetical protein